MSKIPPERARWHSCGWNTERLALTVLSMSAFRMVLGLASSSTENYSVATIILRASLATCLLISTDHVVCAAPKDAGKPTLQIWRRSHATLGGICPNSVQKFFGIRNTVLLPSWN